MQANTIEEVIEQLEEIIQTSIQEESTLGYFAALYQKVTIQVGKKLGQGYFDDDIRMEALDVIFANRYIEAYTNYKSDKIATQSWVRAFDVAENSSLITLQHLFLGMNAHINLDLGIAAAQVSTPENIDALLPDFNRINEILGSMVVEIQADLVEIWPNLFWILNKLKRTDDFIIDFSMTIARDGAWKFAKELASSQNTNAHKSAIEARDIKIANLGGQLSNPRLIIRILLMLIRFQEKGLNSDKIRALQG